MFSTFGLFQSLSCPQRINCNRPSCIFAHGSDLPSSPSLDIPVHQPKLQPVTVPSKRPIHNLVQRPTSGPSEPPAQRRKVGTSQNPAAVPATSNTSVGVVIQQSGVPILKVNAARSQVALPVRQAMLKSLYEHFVILYDAILPSHPTLASEHALRQEEQVYTKSTKLTYRNVRPVCVLRILQFQPIS